MRLLALSDPQSNNRRFFLVCLTLILVVIIAWIVYSKPLYPVVIQTADRDYPLRVELADTPQSREYGLMNRSSLSVDKGMLFLFPEEQQISFWMKNTLIPLDMIFIKENGKIDFIHHNAQPHDETPVTGPSAVIAVLEIAGGQAEKHGIKIGDTVKTPLLSNKGKGN